jgi:hypothetical protein
MTAEDAEHTERARGDPRERPVPTSRWAACGRPSPTASPSRRCLTRRATTSERCSQAVGHVGLHVSDAGGPSSKRVRLPQLVRVCHLLPDSAIRSLRHPCAAPQGGALRRTRGFSEAGLSGTFRDTGRLSRCSQTIVLSDVRTRVSVAGFSCGSTPRGTARRSAPRRRPGRTPLRGSAGRQAVEADAVIG